MQEERQITAIGGDITTVETEAIVNAANNELWMGSGVAGAIKRAGGEEIERQAIAKGPIRIGEAVATGAGKLPHRRVIHAAAMGFHDGQMIGASDESVKLATESALRVADEEGITSVAFPALGTGVGGMIIEECAEVMVNAVANYLARSNSAVGHIVFVLRYDEAKQVFERVISESRSGGLGEG